MTETIVAIRQINSIPGGEEYDNALDGYEIETTEERIRLLMDMGSQCCEKYGYFLSEDDPAEFIGAELLDIKEVNEELKVGSLKKDIGTAYSGEDGEYGLDPANVMFINVETSRGTLQFTAYNAHNGYYSHKARVESKRLTLDVRL